MEIKLIVCFSCVIPTINFQRLKIFWVTLLFFFCWVYISETVSKIIDGKMYLKLVSAIFYEILILHQMIVLQKLWKMFFISSKKLFSFSRYSNFCISTFPSFSPCQPLLESLIQDKSSSLWCHQLSK